MPKQTIHMWDDNMRPMTTVINKLLEEGWNIVNVIPLAYIDYELDSDMNRLDISRAMILASKE